MLPKGLLKEYSRTLALAIRLTDMIGIVMAGSAAYYFVFNQAPMPPFYLSAVLMGALLAPMLFGFCDIYSSVRATELLKHFIDITKAVCMLTVLLAGLAFFTKLGESYSRVWFGVWMLCSYLILFAYRYMLFLFLRFMRSRGLNERRVVIMGAGELGVKFAMTVQQALWTGFRVVTFIDDHAATKGTQINGIPLIQTPKDLGDYLTENNIDEIWLALPLRAEERVKTILHELRHHTITTRFVLNIFGLDLLNHSMGEIAHFPVLNIRSTPMVGGNRLMKAFEDRLLAAIILLCISPLFLPIMLAVKLSSPGPIFYRQKRISWNGQEFEMLKFRTMPVGTEQTSGPVWAKQNDGRATRIGSFLRKTSLDELPQFINVLKGDMSIVGPRPERKVFVDEFKEKIPRYMQKHLVKAGITGWAQVNGWRGNTSLEKRIEYDLYYIENWSLFFDLKIIWLTLFKGFVNRNAY